MIETKRVVSILTDLEGINEDLVNLYDDIKENIDPHDPVARSIGSRQLVEYGERLDAFEKVAAELRSLIERITNVDMQQHTIGKPTDGSRRLAGRKPHSPNEWFTHTHVIGFTFFEQEFLVSKWYRFYATLLQQLAERSPEHFKQLPDTSPFNGDQRHTSFARSPEGFRAPLPLPYGLYTNTSLSVKDMFVNVRRLLVYFNVPEGGLVVYLREDGEER